MMMLFTKANYTACSVRLLYFFNSVTQASRQSWHKRLCFTVQVLDPSIFWDTARCLPALPLEKQQHFSLSKFCFASNHLKKRGKELQQLDIPVTWWACVCMRSQVIKVLLSNGWHMTGSCWVFEIVKRQQASLLVWLGSTKTWLFYSWLVSYVPSSRNWLIGTVIGLLKVVLRSAFTSSTPPVAKWRNPDL